MKSVQDTTSLFDQFKDSVLGIDPVYFCERNLVVDGTPLKLIGTGYKPFADIYRYIGMKAIEKNAKPVVLVKGRQVGATTMAAALECYFAGCDFFGKNGRSPMRIIHLFPTLSLAAAYTKDKLDSIISQSRPIPGMMKSNGMLKSFMEAKFDVSSPVNNNMGFKKFLHGNQVWIDSTGLDGDRIRGRMLDLNTELPTPLRGFIKLKDLQEGDELFDDNGDVCKCIKLHPICQAPESYRVTFDDGTTVDACADHLWLTYTKKDRNINCRNTYKMKRRIVRREQGLEYKPFLEKQDRKQIPTVKTTKEILDTLMCGNEYNHSIPVIPYAKYSEKELLIHPYILGLWLGDGFSNSGSIASADPEEFDGYDHYIVPSSVNIYNHNCFNKDGYSKSNNYRIPGLTSKLKKLNLINNKHIPDVYLYSSYEQRLALLQGLMDTDGCCYKNDGRCEFTQIVDREILVFQVKELINSLGIKCRVVRKNSFRYGKQYKDKYQIIFSTNKPVFRLKRKLERLNNKDTSKKNHRFIRSIEPIAPVPMRCITVDSPSHLYLITRSYIPTHNTVDCALFDECFPYDQFIKTNTGKERIGKLYKDYVSGAELPLVETYNENTRQFEYQKILKVWKRDSRNLVLVRLCNRKIKCTPNHLFLTTNGWIEAAALRSGDLVLSTQATSGQINYQLNKDQLQVVLGSFLGGGHISNHGNRQYRLRVRHGIEQSEYCKWKANMFGCNTSFIEKNGYTQKPAVFFATKLFSVPFEFPKTKNTCPQFVLDNLDARGLAVWFMDACSSNDCINTCSFNEDSQQRIVKKLQSFGIDCKYSWYARKDGSGYFSIYLSAKGYSKLCEIIASYVHKTIKRSIDHADNYVWNNKFYDAGLLVVKSVENVKTPEIVYDLEVENNHNFIATSGRKSSDKGGVIVHNCQDTPEIAIGAVTKILTQSRYGATGEGIQVYFGTPKRKGGLYWNMWQSSTQNYFHLGCEKCGKLFPLYRPDVNWEEIWIYGFTVRCPECGHEQDKIQAQERGKWIPLNDEKKCKFIGYHINQLYIPTFSKETIIKLKPENNPINTERIYMNEVLGEFHDGEGGTISVTDIQDRCMDKNRFMIKGVNHDFKKRTYAGFDWGQRSALNEIAGRGKGQSFSCCVILTVEGSLFNVEFATKLNHNTPEYKMEVVEEMFRRYKPYLAVGDIGDAGDLTHNLQKVYDDKFLASRSSHKVIGHVKYSKEEWPKTIIFEKDYYISELISLLKEGRIRFPQKSFEKISWLIQHCASMDIKVTRDKSGEPIKKYVKGDGPNDGMMALLNAYLAWKFDVTQGFTISNPLHMQYTVATEKSPVQAVLGYIPNMFGGRR